MRGTGNQLVKNTFYGILTVNVISMVSGILCVMIDAIVTGQFLGTDAVTATGLLNPIVMLSNLLGALFGPGVGIVCTRYMGMAQPKRVNQAFSIVMITVLVSVGALSVALFALAPVIANALGGGTGNAQITGMMSDYLHGFAFALVPMCLTMGLSGLMMLDNDRKRGIAAMVVTLGGDVALDLANVLIFHGGMLGMALATALSNLLGLLVVLTHFLRKDRILRFTRQELQPGDLKDVMLCGIPNVISMGSQALRVFCFNTLLLAIAGNGVVAALSVANSSFSIITGVSLGLFTTTSTLCSLLYGEEDRNGLITALSISLRTSILSFAVLAAVFLAFAHPIAGIFLDASAADAMAQAARFIRFMGLQYLLTSVSFCLSGAYQGTQRLSLNYLIDAMREGVFPLLCCITLGLLFGLHGFELGFIAAGALTLLLCILIPWKGNGRFTLAPRDLLLLPKEFGARPEELFEATMQTMDQVMAVSEQVMRFCKDKGADRRTAMLTALFVEEMAGNTVQHGFLDQHPCSIELRFLYGTEMRSIRLRDNGRPFDPLDWIERNHPEDPCSGAGIRIIVGLAKEVQYIPTMGLNNLMVLF